MRWCLRWLVLGCFAWLLCQGVGGWGPAVAQDLLQPPPEAAKVTLSNLRQERDRFGRAVLVVDYRVATDDPGYRGSAQVTGKTRGGRLAGSYVNLERSGQIRLALAGALMVERDFEVYLVTRGGPDTFYKVSNSVTLGQPGGTTSARAWTAEEKQRHERAKRYRTPPSRLPAGMVAAERDTPLVPGMPIKGGYMGQWVDAEVLAIADNGSVTFKLQGREALELRPRAAWIAIDPAVLARAEQNPAQFKPSVKVLPGSRLPVPEGAVPLDDAGLLDRGIGLPKGTPLLVDYGHQWHDCFVLEDGVVEIKLRYKGWSSTWDKSEPRSKFLIAKSTLALLGKDGTEERFLANVGSEKVGGAEMPGAFGAAGEWGGSGSGIEHKSYPIKGELPRGAVKVPEGLTIPVGTQLSVFWGSRWRGVKVLKANADGSLRVRWDDWSESWDCNIIRDELVIDQRLVSKLRRRATVMARQLERPRTWTDSTGKFKVEAVYVGKTDTQVTLRRADGVELTLDLEKLSEKDRDLVLEFGDQVEQEADENPFEPESVKNPFE